MRNSITRTLNLLRHYLQLLRPHHWIKNILVLVPLFFGRYFLDPSHIIGAVFGFICFSLLSSIIYIFNDIRDLEKDRLHSIKCHRPLPAGKITVSNAIITLVILSLSLIALLIVLVLSKNSLFNIKSAGLLLLYALLNIGYSLRLKNIPIVDITILASGYIIRVLFGAMIIDINISVWLYLVITTGAYYLGLGKRRNEINGNEKNTPPVMYSYTHNFLDKNMHVCMTLCIVFYTLWSIDPVTVKLFQTTAFVYTIPFVLIIFFKYSLNVESNVDGDPTSIILNDKILLSLCVIYFICIFSIIYQKVGVS